jgi:hypothetical protein
VRVRQRRSDGHDEEIEMTLSVNGRIFLAEKYTHKKFQCFFKIANSLTVL